MIQSLFKDDAEYYFYSRLYNTYNPSGRSSKPPIRKTTINGVEFQVGPPPNYIMGNSLTPAEIKLINTRLLAVMKAAGITWATTF